MLLSYEVLEYLRGDGNLSLTKLLKQHWNQERFDYRSLARPDHGLMFVLHGEVELRGEGVSLTASAGDLVFLPKNSRYEAVFDGETEDYLVNFNVSGAEPKFSAPVRILHGAPLSCSEGIASLVGEKYFENPSDLRLKGLFYLLLDNVAKAVTGRDSKDYEAVEKAKTMLCGENEVKVQEIARLCGISESVLRRRFREEVGCSPARYRLLRKLEKAKYLLESTDLSVAEIADALHFYDGAYFCKTFRSHVGMTPMQFAKRKEL
ncbi:MAG: AraC family transcriptional regulator [Clostridia bacterium]|nr:AraC family transcriptional regulator [Clostridia bacterium]